MDLLRLKGLSARELSAARDAVEGYLKGIWTALPAIIGQDSDGHTATAQSSVKQIVTAIDGSTSTIQFPDFATSPVHYPGGGGVSHTHPVKQGDEGIALFLSMPQDLWHQNGGIQDPVDGRRHHLSDSRWLPGGRSDPRKLSPAPSTTSQQNRSDDGNHVWDLHPQNGLTASSQKKHLVLVGGSNGSGTIHLPSPGQIIKNAAKVLINCVKQSPLPDPGASFANRKAIATMPVGAVGPQSNAIAGLMSSVLSGGASAIFASPIASQASGLSTGIASAVSALTSVSGSSGLLSALSGAGGLSGALTALTAGVGNLSGATTPSTGEFGLSDVLSHAQGLTQFFGTSPVPSAVSLATVLAPLQSGGALQSLATELSTLASQVAAGTMSVSAATTAVNGWASQLTALMSGSNSALSTLQNAAPVLNLALATASAGASLDPNENAVANAVTTANLASLTQIMTNLFTPSASDLASIQAFPDVAASQVGATGGM